LRCQTEYLATQSDRASVPWCSLYYTRWGSIAWVLFLDLGTQ
jgi:hypothetical protein